MGKSRWTFLKGALDQLQNGLPPSGLDAVMADRLEAALVSEDRTRIDEARAELSSFVDLVHAGLPDKVVESLQHPSLDDIALAYEVGQIDFAHQVAERAASKRPEREFVDRLFDWRNQPYVQALYASEKSGVDLANETGRRPETVSRVIGELRAAGIVDCRREGTRLVNFLTPHARAAFQDKGDAVAEKARSHATEQVKARLQEQRNELPVYLRSVVSLTADDDLVGTN